MNRRSLVIVLVGAVAVGSAATLIVQRVRAAGIPPTAALSYTGYLQDGTGAPLAGSHQIAVNLYTSATGGTKLCDFGTAKTFDLSAGLGRFSVALPATCVTAIGANPTTYVQVELDGTPLPATQLEAVPYAVEANHAVKADTAAALTTTWTTYTPTLSENSTGMPVASGHTTTGKWRRVGDSIEVRISTSITAPQASPLSSPGGSEWVWLLPAGLTFANLPGTYPVLGTAEFVEPGGTTRVHICAVIPISTAWVALDCNGLNGSLSASYPVPLYSPATIQIHFTAPVTP